MVCLHFIIILPAKRICKVEHNTNVFSDWPYIKEVAGLHTICSELLYYLIFLQTLFESM